MILQNSLANFSFLTLLGSMVLYWIETSFTQDVSYSLGNPTFQGMAKEGRGEIGEKGEKMRERDTNFINRKFEEFPIGISDSLNFFTDNKNKKNKSFAKYGIILSNILLSLLLLVRWKESGHFPLSNLYESLMFLSWCFTSLHLYVDYYTSGSLGNSSNFLLSIKKENQEFYRKLLGAITTPSALLTNAFATFTLPKEMQEVAPLVPALQSNWLMMHVTVMILSYAALILGSLLSIAFLIVTADIPRKFEEFPNFSKNEVASFGSTSSGSLPSPTQKPTNQPIALILDNLSYRILGIGFPLLTIGILSGAVWANEAWGSYWSWDPKETWALLTWLIFAIYLHTRLSKGWEGKKPAIIASFGFVIVWICYLGVNLIGEGLHSYGWIIKS